MNKLTFEALHGIYENEKTLDGLQPAPQDLYEAMEQYAQELEHNIMQSQDYKERDLLRDMLHNSMMMIEAVCEYREHKILDIAFLAKQGISQDPQKMTEAEQKLFSVVLSALNDFTKHKTKIY